MEQRGRVFFLRNENFNPIPERVLITSVCYDASIDGENFELPSSITSNSFQDGFGEYSTNLPEKYKFHTNQRCYGLSFLEANVKGPTYLQYPCSADLEKHLASGHYDILAISAISAYTWSLPWAIGVAQRAKTRYGFKEAWLGGYAVMTDETAITRYFDRLFWGYSESNLNLTISGSPIPTKKIKHPDLTTRVNFLGKESVIGHIIFQRGCPNKCSYCADPVFQPGGETSLSFESIEEILYFYQQKGIRSIYFSNQNTNLFTHTGRRIVDSMYTKGMRFGMLTSFRSLSVKGTDGIRMLHDKGLHFLLVGLELLNDYNLIKTQRRVRYREMYDILKILQDLKITVTATYMICFEDDTPETIREAKRKMINDLGITVCLFNITMPLPSTPMYWAYKRNQLIFDWNWTHWTGNHLVWKHPCISPDQARELLFELRAEVNSPDFNPNVKIIWDSRSKRRLDYGFTRYGVWKD